MKCLEAIHKKRCLECFATFAPSRLFLRLREAGTKYRGTCCLTFAVVDSEVYWSAEILMLPWSWKGDRPVGFAGLGPGFVSGSLLSRAL